MMVIGDFNGWSEGIDLAPDPSGVWNGYIPDVAHGAVYKYRITGPSGEVFDKADPVAFKAEEPPRTASVVWDPSYERNDGLWMAGRGENNSLNAPISIYELHLGSWRYEPGGYQAIAPQLAAYVTELERITHVLARRRR